MTRRRPHLRRAPPPGIPAEALELFGAAWAPASWHARLWARLLVEIPARVYEYRTRGIDSHAGRIAEIRAYYPSATAATDPEVRALTTGIEEIEAVTCALSALEPPHADACAVASVSRVVRPWPNEAVARVAFAVSLAGEVRVQSSGLPASAPKLPTHVTRRGGESAEDAATWLVRAAIEAVGPVAWGRIDGGR